MTPSPVSSLAAWRAAALHCLCEPDQSTKAAQTRALVQRDVTRWTRLVQEAGIRAD